LLSLDQLTNLIARGEQLDVIFEIDRFVYALLGLTDGEIIVKGKA